MLKIVVETKDNGNDVSDVSIEGEATAIEIFSAYFTLSHVLQELKDKFVKEVSEKTECTSEKAEQAFDEALQKTQAIKLGGNN